MRKIVTQSTIRYGRIYLCADIGIWVALSSSSPNLLRTSGLTQKEGILGIPNFVEIGSPGKYALTTGEPIDVREIAHFQRLTGQVS